MKMKHLYGKIQGYQVYEDVNIQLLEHFRNPVAIRNIRSQIYNEIIEQIIDQILDNVEMQLQEDIK